MNVNVSARSAGPRLSLIAALDRNGLIGRDGTLPWHLPDDLAHFKRLTLGKTILMGRRTWDSLPRALPQRENWVLSRAPGFAPAGARVFASVDAALDAATTDELMVIGGAELYRQTLARAQTLYLTRVLAALPPEPGDVRFPAFDETEFELLSRKEHKADARHAHAFVFEQLQRR